ncbi:hypothetical protein ACIQLK_11745 [Microbacterium sp. NPDC091382]|uniref:hypothetical protein n=1 Tax=Microbacterium sp. NPDC091382 TaxID=3364210 RepID=UPI00382A0146
MGRDIDIPMSDLESLDKALRNIADEFEHAGRNANQLEGWIGTPHGESGLRDEIDRFESAWNDKRDTLRDSVISVQEQVATVGKSWADFDSEAAASLDNTTRTPQVEE